MDERCSRATSQRSRTAMMSSGLRQERARWSWKLQELQRRLQSVVGDALLSAAAVELLGPYGPEHREELMGHWKAVLEQFSIPHSKVLCPAPLLRTPQDLDLASYWLEATSRHRLHTELSLPKDLKSRSLMRVSGCPPGRELGLCLPAGIGVLHSHGIYRYFRYFVCWL